MRSKKSNWISVILACVLVATLVSAVGCSSSDEKSKEGQITITDLADRTVTLDAPVEKVVLASSRHLHEFAALLGEDFVDVIVGWGPDLNLWDQDTYLVYEEKFPEIADITDVGYHGKQSFSAETAISLEPDVFILPLWFVDTEGVGDDILKLEKAGIPSVFIDFNIDPIDNPVVSIELLGQILGVEDRAEEIVNFYQDQVDLVTTRLADIDGPKTTAYVEVGSKGPSEYGSTRGSTGFGVMITEAGGENIAADLPDDPISKEYLLAENTGNPDVIFISGSYWTGVSDSMRMGYHANVTDSTALLEAFTERTGWDNLDAVENNRVYSLYHGFSFRIYNFAGILAFAKWLYPDEFEDIDPAAVFQEFHEEFMPVDYSGVWLLSLQS